MLEFVLVFYWSTKVYNARPCKLGAQMKTLQGENEHMISEIKFFKNEANKCKKSLTKSTKKHDEKVKKLEKEQELLRISEDRCHTQLLDLNLQIEKLKPMTGKTESGNQTEKKSISQTCGLD